MPPPAALHKRCDALADAGHAPTAEQPQRVAALRPGWLQNAVATR